MSVGVVILVVLALAAYAAYELFGSRVKSLYKAWLPLVRVSVVVVVVIILLYTYFQDSATCLTIMDVVLPGNVSKVLRPLMPGSVAPAPRREPRPLMPGSVAPAARREPRLPEPPAYVGHSARTVQASQDTNETQEQPAKARHRRSVSQYRKKSVAASQQWRCAICTHQLDAHYEVDHILALQHGGTNEESNLRALCRPCHARKTAEEREDM